MQTKPNIEKIVPFWESKTVQEIALSQGVKPVENFEDLLGGWPEDELDDHFEEAVEYWRHGKLPE